MPSTWTIPICELNLRAVQGSHVVEFDSWSRNGSSGNEMDRKSWNLWQEPRDTPEPFLHLEDGALQPAVGEGVLLVEGQATLVGEETVPIFRIDLLNVFR